MVVLAGTRGVVVETGGAAECRGRVEQSVVTCAMDPLVWQPVRACSVEQSGQPAGLGRQVRH